MQKTICLLTHAIGAIDDSRRGKAGKAVEQVHRDTAQRMVIIDDRTVDPRQQEDAPV